MSYYLVDGGGKYLGDLATNRGVMELRGLNLGPLTEFLDAGETDDPRSVAEAVRGTKADYLADLLLKAQPPVTLTDGLT